jgi:hypothetical protein
MLERYDVSSHGSPPTPPFSASGSLRNFSSKLSQAQYQQTDAAIANTNAQDQYQLSLTALNYQIGTAP